MRGALGPLQTKALEIMREVLGDDFLSLTFVDYHLDATRDGPTSITCTLVEHPSERSFSIAGEGVGLIDAFFAALRERYRGEHPSLETIQFSGFSVRSLRSADERDNQARAKAEATVGIHNSAGHAFEFAAVSSSVGHSSIEGVLAAVEYFVNSERAYVRIYKALQHHRTTGRPELVSRYTELLAEMVRNTSYSSAVERLKASS